MQVWFDQTQPWFNLTWMLLHTASASGCSSCTGTGTLVFSTRDSQAGSSILDHGDAFDHIFMTTKIKQTSKAWTFMENYWKVIKIPPWRFNKKKAGHHLTAQTVRSLQAIQPFCWHPPWSRWQPPVALLQFRCSLSSWSEAGNQGETIDGPWCYWVSCFHFPPKFCFKKEFSMVAHVAERIAFKWYMCTSSSKSSEFLSIA